MFEQIPDRKAGIRDTRIDEESEKVFARPLKITVNDKKVNINLIMIILSQYCQ